MKAFKVNQKVIYHTEDFDGSITCTAVITEVNDDHYIAETADGMKLWIDEDTEEFFTIEEG